MLQSPAPRSVKRSPQEAALRVGLAAIALAIGYVSTTQSLAIVVHKTDAERAHDLAPRDGRVAGKLAEQIAAGEVDSVQRVRATKLAHEALADEPLSTTALTALAVNAQIGGDTTTARRLFGHSDQLSRRELGTRLWFIEDAVERNDIAGALHNYDIALRTSKAAPDLLFPILSNAAADPEIARSLATLLTRQHPSWSEAFIQYLSGSSANPIVVARLFRQLTMLGYTIPDMAKSGVVNSLVAKGAFEDAWHYYASIRTPAVRNQSRDPDFFAQLQVPSAFDWNPVINDAGLTASIEHTGDKGIFEFAAPSTVGGLVLQQVQLLPSGRYRLEGVSRGIDQPREASPYWQLSCTDGREIGRVEIINSSESDKNFYGEFVVGNNGCKAQILRLIVRPSMKIGGVTGQIKHATLKPISHTKHNK